MPIAENWTDILVRRNYIRRPNRGCETNAFYAYDDFYEFGLKIGLVRSRVEKILAKFRSNSEKVQSLTERSFLNGEMKKAYMNSYYNKLKALNYSMAGRI